MRGEGGGGEDNVVATGLNPRIQVRVNHAVLCQRCTKTLRVLQISAFHSGCWSTILKQRKTLKKGVVGLSQTSLAKIADAELNLLHVK